MEAERDQCRPARPPEQACGGDNPTRARTAMHRMRPRARSISVDVDESPYAAPLMARIRNAKRPAQSSAATTSNSCAARGVAGRFCSDNKTATRPAGTLTRKSQCHVATLRMAGDRRAEGEGDGDDQRVETGTAA